MIPRTIAPTLLKLSHQYPVLTVVGPRQVGKTTLVRALFSHKPYVNLEDPDNREFALSDPRRFMSQFKEGAVIDEIQRAPLLLSYIQVVVDEKKTEGSIHCHWQPAIRFTGCRDAVISRANSNHFITALIH